MQLEHSCFCGSTQSYSHCCLPFINRDKFPLSAEALMRSRYCAFYIGDVDYLIDTLLPNKRKADDREKIQSTIESTQWLGLKIITATEFDKNQVEFVAFFEEDNNRVGQLHEKSNFIQVDNKWFYVDGLHLSPLKLKRNDICFCGSGQKLKKCHLK